MPSVPVAMVRCSVTNFFSALAGYAAPNLVETDKTFTTIDLAITVPKTDGDLVLTPTEINEMTKASAAKDINDVVGGIETHDAMLQLQPCTHNPLGHWSDSRIRASKRCCKLSIILSVSPHPFGHLHLQLDQFFSKGAVH